VEGPGRSHPPVVNPLSRVTVRSHVA